MGLFRVFQRPCIKYPPTVTRPPWIRNDSHDGLHEGPNTGPHDGPHTGPTISCCLPAT